MEGGWRVADKQAWWSGLSDQIMSGSDRVAGSNPALLHGSPVSFVL